MDNNLENNNWEEKRRKHYEYMSEKVSCECGTITARNNMSHHRKSKKHLKFVEENKNSENKIKEMNEKINLILERLEKLEK